MNYRMEQKSALRIVGISQPLSKVMEENFQTVPKLWDRVAVDGTIERLVPLMDQAMPGVLGVSFCNQEDDRKYIIGVVSEKPAEAPLEAFTIPAATWAVFPGDGPMPVSIQELEKRIFSEWLPTSGYEYANLPDIELYLSPDPQNAKYEVWIPVIKK